MAKAKAFIFAPADQTGESHKKLEDAGCELVMGKASWDTPQGDTETQMARLAQGCDALLGTSIRSTPITRKIMEGSDKLRIVAKYTIGVDDVDVDAATELGILVAHGPREPPVRRQDQADRELGGACESLRVTAVSEERTYTTTRLSKDASAAISCR